MRYNRLEKYYKPKYIDDTTNLSKMVINPLTGKLEMPKFFRRSVKSKVNNSKVNNDLPICPKCHNVLPLSGECDFCGTKVKISSCSHLCR